jgi:hypothetical protein
VDVNVNRFNAINVNRVQIHSNVWRHDVTHRGGLAYRNAEAMLATGPKPDAWRSAGSGVTAPAAAVAGNSPSGAPRASCPTTLPLPTAGADNTAAGRLRSGLIAGPGVDIAWRAKPQPIAIGAPFSVEFDRCTTA